MTERGPRFAEQPEFELPDNVVERLDSLGAAYVPGALSEFQVASLRADVDTAVYVPAKDTERVRQEALTAKLLAPYGEFPAIADVAEQITLSARSLGVEDTAFWEASEATIMAYEKGSVGITPHLDGRRYHGLIAIFTVVGRGGFAVLPERDAVPSIVWTTEPGDLVLLRGTGWRGQEDGRPFHAAGSPQGGTTRVPVVPPGTIAVATGKRRGSGV